ncbi:MAG: hypothetical protein Q4C37_11225 [Bacteroidales bacterium]|nr:hypothetical protein [Bacteroidales bacterium]
MLRKIRIILAAMMLPLAVWGADMKFQKKAAEKVWGTRSDLFDPMREIPDSLKEHFSAVVIGQYDYLEADYNSYETQRGVETHSKRVYFTRRMVKLLDQKAVEEFSKHEFGSKAAVKSRYRRTMAEIKHTFGARIHKPDGRMVEVDMSKAFDITEGKGKGDVLKQKIDIAGLEPGDVLEYFTFAEDRAQEYDLPALRMMLAGEYPVLESVIEGKFHPKLTVEFREYNAAPEIECSVDSKGQNTAWMKTGYMPALTDRHYVNKIRELPFYDFYVLNNTSPYRYYPKYSRNGGLYQNPNAMQIFRDISLVIAASNYDKSNFPGKVRKMIKNYRQAHPEATAAELTDAAWAAANYINLTDKDADVSDYWLALMMCDVLRKEKIADDAGVAFINSSADVPTAQIVNWRQPDYGMKVGDRLYLCAGMETFMSGELSPVYEGQLCAAFPGERSRLWDFSMPEITTTPVSKHSANKFAVTSEITLGPDNDAEVSNQLTLTGAMKYLASDLSDYTDWLREQEEYLGIEEGKRYRVRNKDEEGKAKDIEESTRELYEDIFGGDEFELSDVAISSRGMRPGDPEFKMTFRSKTPEVYSVAGNDLILKIGSFTGRQKRIEGVERSRTANIQFLAASQDNYSITVGIPEGYDVDDAALQALTSNVQTHAGLFVSGAKRSADGKSVNVVARKRINLPLIVPTAWEDILKLTDAHAAFADAILVFRKK